MMCRSRFVLPVFALSGCMQIGNPCPHGSEPDRVQQQCVPVVDYEQSDGMVADPGRNGGTDLDSGADASMQDQDASMDTGVEDGGPDPSAEAGPCSTHDVEAWRAFHVNDGAVETMTTCIEQNCDGGTCYP